MGTCHTGTSCTTTPGQICNASHTCANCTDDSGCQASYTDGRICVGNSCVVGNCHDNGGCSNGRICTNNKCVDCTSDTQCATGQLCIGGGCTNGNCRRPPTATTRPRSAPTTSAVCAPRTRLHGHQRLRRKPRVQRRFLQRGRLPREGRLHGDREDLRRATPLTCGACTGANADANCASEYGAGHICNSGVCVTGTCHDSATCTAGQVCDSTSHTCTGCGSGHRRRHSLPGRRQVRRDLHLSGERLHRRQLPHGGHLQQHGAGLQQLHLRHVQHDPDCTNAYGANHVCSGGACISGTATAPPSVAATSSASATPAWRAPRRNR